MIKGLVFDVDGVIINTENTHCLAYQKVFKKVGQELTPAEYKQHFSGKSIMGGLASYLPHTPLDHKLNDPAALDELAHQKISTTIELFKDQVIYFEDTLEFIKRVAEGGVKLGGIGEIIQKPKLAMATGLESVLMNYVLAHHNLQNIFTVVVAADQYTHSKPNPECYQLALERMNLKPHDVIGIEDSISGVKALNNAGIFSVAITNTHSQAELHEAKHITEALTELIEG